MVITLKYNHTIGFPYGLLLLFNSNIWPISAPLRDIRLQSLSDLNFDLSRSLKVKCDSVIAFCIYAFLLMINSNIILVWPNTGPLQDIRLRNLSDLGIDLWRTLKIKCDDVIGLSIHGFLMIYDIHSFSSQFSHVFALAIHGSDSIAIQCAKWGWWKRNLEKANHRQH